MGATSSRNVNHCYLQLKPKYYRLCIGDIKQNELYNDRDQALNVLKKGSVLTEEELYNNGEKILEYDYTDITNELKKIAKQNQTCDSCYQNKIYKREGKYNVKLPCYDFQITLNDYDNIIKNLELASGFYYSVINGKLDNKIKFPSAEQGWTYLRTKIGRNILTNQEMEKRGYSIQHLDYTELIKKMKNKRDVFVNLIVITQYDLHKEHMGVCGHTYFSKYTKHDVIYK